MNRAFAKIFLFLLIIVSLILMVKKSVQENYSVQGQVNSNQNETLKTTSLYFIGSSRVDMSIDKTIMDSAFTEHNFFKLGITGSTFLGNSIIAEKIIKTTGHKIICMELSALLNELPESVIQSSGSRTQALKAALRITQEQSIAEKSMMLMDILNQQFFSAASIKGDIIKLFAKMQNVKVEQERKEFDPHKKNNLKDNSSFLKYTDLSQSIVRADNLIKYKQIIEYLNRLAERHHAELIFFLPLTYNKQSERDIVLSVFNQLPASMKLGYTNHFLQEISKPEYLYDKNHLNKEGAITNSRLLIPLLKNHPEIR